MTDAGDGSLDPSEVIAIAREIGRHAEPFAGDHDREASFVAEGYEAIRELGYGTVAVPRELGGGGHDLSTVCRAQAAMAAGCVNTSLAISMHQHTVLSMARRWRRGDTGVESALRRIADGLILCSSGTSDPLNPGVTASRVDGGLRLNGRKGLASGCPGADVLATPILIDDQRGPVAASVLITMSAPGVEVLDTWDAMGMRGSGSNGIGIKDVFVPEDDITGTHELESEIKPADRHRTTHRAPGLLIALTVIAAVYLGAGDGIRERALTDVTKGRHPDDPITYRHVGALSQESRLAWWALEGLLRRTTDDSLLTEVHFRATMLAKRQIVLSSIAMVETAMEMLGSMSYFRRQPYEQALRDVRAGITHPLAPEATLTEVGRSVLEQLQ